jgi:hypothetical protein
MKKPKAAKSKVRGKLWLYADIFLKARRLVFVSMKIDDLCAQGRSDEIKRRIKCLESMESAELRELAVVQLAFSIEAYLNQAGESEIGDWREQWDRANWEQKLSVLCRKIGLHLDKSQDIYRRTKLLFKHRDVIAHGRTMTVTGETPDDPKRYFESQTKFRVLNPDDAFRFLDSTDKLIKLIHSKRTNPEALNRVFTIDVTTPQDDDLHKSLFDKDKA